MLSGHRCPRLVASVFRGHSINSLSLCTFCVVLGCRWSTAAGITVSSGYKDEQDGDSLVGRQCPVLLALWGGLGACSQGLLESLALPGLGRDKDPSFTLET